VFIEYEADVSSRVNGVRVIFRVHLNVLVNDLCRHLNVKLMLTSL